MTIKELEVRLGISRANIRFYEKEGLLRPTRRANGYRDYSEEDAAALEKIALLRRLGMPVETIRQVQTGELPLQTALQRQDQALKVLQMESWQARRLCAVMLEEQVTYAALEPEKYRGALPRPAPSAPALLPEEQREPAVTHWVRRGLARLLDLGLCWGLWFAVGFGLLQCTLSHWLLQLLAAMGLCLLLEPALLAVWGTTPGKYLFGLQLESGVPGPDRRLTYGEALWRTLHVLLHELLLGIPVLSWILIFKVCYDSQQGKVQSWNEDYDYYLAERPRQWAFDLMAAVLAVLLVLLPGRLMALPYAAPLTPAQYAANLNRAMASCGQRGRMTAEGLWKNADGAPAQQIFTDEAGHVCRVRMTVSMERQTYQVYEYGTVQQWLEVWGYVIQSAYALAGRDGEDAAHAITQAMQKQSTGFYGMAEVDAAAEGWRIVSTLTPSADGETAVFAAEILCPAA